MKTIVPLVTWDLVQTWRLGRVPNILGEKKIRKAELDRLKKNIRVALERAAQIPKDLRQESGTEGRVFVREMQGGHSNEEIQVIAEFVFGNTGIEKVR